jgi:hypothetical protein
MLMQQQYAPQESAYAASRAEALHNVETTIVELGSIFTQLAEMVAAQVGALEGVKLGAGRGVSVPTSPSPSFSTTACPPAQGGGDHKPELAENGCCAGRFFALCAWGEDPAADTFVDSIRFSPPLTIVPEDTAMVRGGLKSTPAVSGQLDLLHFPKVLHSPLGR